MVLPPLSHHDASTSWCMGFALWIRPDKVDSKNGIILFRLYTLSWHSDNRYVYFSYPFLFFSDNIHFSMSIVSYTNQNHSGFREHIYFLVYLPKNSPKLPSFLWRISSVVNYTTICVLYQPLFHCLFYFCFN